MKRKRGKRRKKPPLSYRKRKYRQIAEQADLVSSYVQVRETDLHVLAPNPVDEAVFSAVIRYRTQLENYILRHPGFVDSLLPLPSDPMAPPLVREMIRAAAIAGVGPMAAVAGVLAEFVGRDLLAAGQEEVIVENGGDIFLARQRDCTVSIFAGESPLSGRVGVAVACDGMPLGVCCSSASVGHSLSLGQADAVVVIAKSTAVADAAATRIGNEVRETGSRKSLENALAVARDMDTISGVAIIADERLGAWGEVELVRL